MAGRGVVRVNGRPWTPEDDAELLHLSESGSTLSEAARALGRTPTSVRMHAPKVGASFDRKPSSGERRGRRPEGSWDRMGDLAIRECLASGWSLEDASRELGVCKGDVLARARELGLCEGWE